MSVCFKGSNYKGTFTLAAAEKPVKESKSLGK
jgi:hypothetical protein